MPRLVLILCLMLITLAPIIGFVRIAKADTVTNVYIDPPQITGLSVGDSLTINVNVANVSHLAGWEFQLFFNPQVLSAAGFKEGPFLSKVGNTFFYSAPPLGIDNNYNSTHGRVWLTCAILGETVGATGSGTLTNVTFQVVGQGVSTLTLPQNTTKLYDSTPYAPQPIPHTITNGYVGSIINDIAVTSIQLSKTIVSMGAQAAINVTAANLGNFAASFSVALYYGTTEISTKQVTNLAPLASLNISFTWDTTPIPKGNYTMEAYAPPITGETNLANNRLTDGWIKVTILGDVNGDGSVDILDISILARAFLTKPGDPRWNPNGDLDNSGEINIIDITKVAKEFGKKDP